MRTVNVCLAAVLLLSLTHAAAPPDVLAKQKALLESLEVKPGQLMPLLLDTVLVADGKPQAVICHADAPAWREAAVTIQQAIAAGTGVTLELRTDSQLDVAQADSQNVILLGHLDNNRHVARLYHNFFVTLDQGTTGKTGYEIRSVHDPFGAKHNAILVGGSSPDGTKLAAERFAALVKERGKPGALALGRLLELKSDPEGRAEEPRSPLGESAMQTTLATCQRLFKSPGQGRSAISYVTGAGLAFHRTGDPRQGQLYHDCMAALLDYYRTDKTINEDGMARYDNDFRDAWTWQVAVLWDLNEECGLFTDQERLDHTNLLIRLALECELYQGWDRPETLAKWAANQDIIHNHNSFPGLGALFVGNYCQRHYGLKHAEDWLTVARGMFNGQKHSGKPLEDAASYQWLVPVHTMIYSLAENDLTYFTEGNARAAANTAIIVMDGAGSEAAYGDHDSERSSYAMAPLLQMASWAYKDPGLLYAARLAAASRSFGPMDQGYFSTVAPAPPADHVGVALTFLPQQAYDYIVRAPQYPTPPNLPLAQTFDKLSLRAGWDKQDEYVLLDGMGRGTHMHFDNNAIVRFSKGGEPLLVDGEYIKNAPKYHSNLVILRDGQGQLTPPVTGLLRADDLGSAAYTRTFITDYNGADWTRSLLWRRGDYLLVSDEVRPTQPGDYTLRSCWRPWGDVTVQGERVLVKHPPMRLTVAAANGLPWRVETMKTVEKMPVSRLSQQLTVRPEPGAAVQFVALVAADPADKPRDFSLRRVGDGLVVVDGPSGSDVIALGRKIGPGVGALPGLSVTGYAVAICPDRIILGGCSKLEGKQPLLQADGEVSLELAPQAGTVAISSRQPVSLSLRIGPNGKISGEGIRDSAGANGLVALVLPAGEFAFKCDPFPMYPEVVAAAQAVKALPTASAATAAAAVPSQALPLAWRFGEFRVPPRPLPVASITASEEVKVPITRLVDGEYQASTNSVGFPAGKTVTITAELAHESAIHSILLREWHMNPTWDIGDRKAEISSDGFAQDIRPVTAAFADTGKESFGSNVNTLMELPVGQKAKQVRLTLAAARPDSNVYLAEIELRGNLPGAPPEVRSCATGDLDGDGAPEVVAGTSGGEIVALNAAGQRLWGFQLKDIGPMDALACMDANGDGKSEVIYGTNKARLGMLSADGKPAWEITLPAFRGISSDVKTIFPADINGDKRPEIGCGCLSWQYFAVDATGKQLWGHVIYAHSATVGVAADIDADGKDEVIAGDNYYTLNVIDDNGQRLWRSSNIGPEMTAVAAVNVDADPQPEVLTGVDDGTVYCYDNNGQKLWQVNLGDKVTRMIGADVNGDGQPEIICSAESAHVFALKGDGTILWRTALPDGAGDLAVARDGSLLVAAGGAGVIVLDKQGKPTAAAATPGRVQNVLACGAGAVAVTDAGQVVGLK